MIRKLTLLAGFGAGYVLGAKAGTERYNQIVAKAKEISGQPAVQEVTTNLQQTASTVADKAKDTANQKVQQVNEKVGGSGSSSSSSSSSAGSDSDVVDLSGHGAATGATGASSTGSSTPPLGTTGRTTPAPAPGAAPSGTAPIVTKP